MLRTAVPYYRIQTYPDQSSFRISRMCRFGNHVCADDEIFIAAPVWKQRTPRRGLEVSPVCRLSGRVSDRTQQGQSLQDLSAHAPIRALHFAQAACRALEFK